jgi:predicted AAA+ superfamily ATPase
LSSKTVEKYIDVLERAFVIFKVSSFSKNLRNELKKSHKIYFYDVGVRNALISQFALIENRLDKGPLWENFIIAERKKFLHYQRRKVNCWFWRTTDQAEVDWIEEENGELRAFEFKYKGKSTAQLSKKFRTSYPEAKTMIVSPENIHEFLL